MQESAKNRCRIYHCSRAAFRRLCSGPFAGRTDHPAFRDAFAAHHAEFFTKSNDRHCFFPFNRKMESVPTWDVIHIWEGQTPLSLAALLYRPQICGQNIQEFTVCRHSPQMHSSNMIQCIVICLMPANLNQCVQRPLHRNRRSMKLAGRIRIQALGDEQNTAFGSATMHSSI